MLTIPKSGGGGGQILIPLIILLYADSLCPQVQYVSTTSALIANMLPDHE